MTKYGHNRYYGENPRVGLRVKRVMAMIRSRCLVKCLYLASTPAVLLEHCLRTTEFETVATGSVRTEHCIYRCVYLYRNASCVVYPIRVQCHVEAYMFVNIKSVVFLESRWFLLHVRNNIYCSATVAAGLEIVLVADWVR